MPDIGSPVYPGDILRNIASIKGVTILGPGLKRNDTESNTIQITQHGVLRHKKPNIYWIETRQKSYTPKRGDLVVGVIIKKSGDLLKVDIGGGETASVSLLAFEGATKRQKPDIQIGDLIYGRVVNAHREMEPELACVDSYFKAGKLGVLPNDGHLIDASLELVYRLLNIDNPLLRTLGKKFPFEIVIGMNGKIWINARTIKNILIIVRALETAALTNDQIIMHTCQQVK